MMQKYTRKTKQSPKPKGNEKEEKKIMREGISARTWRKWIAKCQVSSQ